MDIIAHRGAHDDIVGENTLAAFREAVELGADALELDVRLTKDGQAVVCHDADIFVPGIDGILSGKHHLQYYNLSELLLTGLVTDRPEVLDEVTAPTLRVVLQEFLPQISINIELKDHWACKAVHALLDRLTFDRELIRSRVYVSSFILEELIHFRRLDPDIEVGLLFKAGDHPVMRDLNNYRTSGFNALHFHSSVPEEIVRQAKHWGFNVRIYTVNEVASFEHYDNWGVDGIFTDNLTGMLAERTRLESTAV